MTSDQTQIDRSHNHVCPTFWAFFRNKKDILDLETYTIACEACGATLKPPNIFFRTLPKRLLLLSFIFSSVTWPSIFILRNYFNPYLVVGIWFAISIPLFYISRRCLVAKMLSQAEWCEVQASEESEQKIWEELRLNASELKSSISNVEFYGQYVPIFIAQLIVYCF